jgi:hypothetical protein
MGRMIDSVRLKWDRFVIQYSFRDQMAVAQGIRERGEQVRVQFTDWTAMVRGRIHAIQLWMAQATRSSAVLLTVIATVGLMAWLAIWFWRSGIGVSGWNISQSHRHYRIAQIYLRMLRMLRRRGFEKAPGATPLEFLRVVQRDWDAASRFVQPLTDLYCRVRFGQDALTAEEIRQAHAWLRGLRAQHRRSSRATMSCK